MIPESTAIAALHHLWAAIKFLFSDTAVQFVILMLLIQFVPPWWRRRQKAKSGELQWEINKAVEEERRKEESRRSLLNTERHLETLNGSVEANQKLISRNQEILMQHVGNNNVHFNAESLGVDKLEKRLSKRLDDIVQLMPKRG